MATPVTLVTDSGVAYGPTNAFPYGGTLLNATSGNVAAASAVATLPAVASRTNYITGFDMTGTGATAAAVVTVTVAGLAGGSITFIATAVAGATLANPVLSIRFPAPIPASAVNTAITVTCPSLGAGNTNNVVNAYGFLV